MMWLPLKPLDHNNPPGLQKDRMVKGRNQHNREDSGQPGGT